MAIIQDWMPPSRENWELVVYLFQFFPLVTIAQWVQPWYGAGKTSSSSSFNIPGKIAWISMEVWGVITLLYVMYTLPAQHGIESLPWQNKAMGALFVIHYIYRAVIAPLIAPSMSPIHPLVWFAAICFQVVNGLSIGAWLGGYGPTTRFDWAPPPDLDSRVGGARMGLGVAIWVVGFIGNIFHDDELREIRRGVARNHRERAAQAAEGTGKGKGMGQRKMGSNGGVAVDKVYMVPKNGLFWFILYPHYLCEWIEWGGFWLMAGSGCVPARNFLLNEIATMLPRAIQGKKWYEERFGKEKIARRKAIIPGVL